jgi:hypothetical protein
MQDGNWMLWLTRGLRPSWAKGGYIDIGHWISRQLFCFDRLLELSNLRTSNYSAAFSAFLIHWSGTVHETLVAYAVSSPNSSKNGKKVRDAKRRDWSLTARYYILGSQHYSSYCNIMQHKEY